jgi:hypothetical protein
MKNDWDKSPNDRKEEAFYASDDTKDRVKKKRFVREVDKHFVVESRHKEVSNQLFQFMLEWSCKKKFETVELAQRYVDKLKREAYSDRREFRIIDLREGNER